MFFHKVSVLMRVIFAAGVLLAAAFLFSCAELPPKDFEENPSSSFEGLPSSSSFDNSSSSNDTSSSSQKDASSSSSCSSSQGSPSSSSSSSSPSQESSSSSSSSVYICYTGSNGFYDPETHFCDSRKNQFRECSPKDR
jgi:hypothetical protein